MFPCTTHHITSHYITYAFSLNLSTGWHSCTRLTITYRSTRGKFVAQPPIPFRPLFFYPIHDSTTTLPSIRTHALFIIIIIIPNMHSYIRRHTCAA